MTRIARCLALCALLALSLNACSTRQAYESTREWQRQACNRLLDERDRSACLQRINPDYDSYQRQTQRPPR